MSAECGYRLENPFLLSSSVVSSSYDMCRRAFDYERCNGCGRCYVSCMDGGHQTGRKVLDAETIDTEAGKELMLY